MDSSSPSIGALRLPLSALMLALAVSACADEEPPAGPSADGAESHTTLELGATDPTSDVACAPMVVEDEYGFEIEIESCPAEIAESREYENMVDFIGSPEARIIGTAGFERLVLQTGCPGPSTYEGTEIDTDTFEAALESIPKRAVANATAELFRMVTIADEACLDGLDAWMEPTHAALVLAQELTVSIDPDALLIDLGTPAEFRDAPTHFSARVAATADSLYAAWSGVSEIEASALWLSSAQMLHYRGIQRLVDAGDTVDTMVIGDSMTARGIDPTTLEAITGRRTINLGMGGTNYAEHWGLVRYAVEQMPTVDHLVWADNTHEFFRGCDSARVATRMTDALNEADAAFEPIAALRLFNPTERLFGSPDTTYGSTEIFADGTRNYGVWESGLMEPMDRSPQAIERRKRTGTRTWRATYDFDVVPICEERIASIADAIEATVATGTSVTVVLMPTTAQGLEIHPEGYEGGHRIAAELAEEQFELSGATVHNLTQAIPDDQFADLFHLGPIGRQTLSERLAELLIEDARG